MRKKRWIEKSHFKWMLVMIVLVLGTVGCGGASTDVGTKSAQTVMNASSDQIYYEEAYVQETNAGEGSREVSMEQETDNMASQSADRKLIKTVSMDVETEEFDVLIANIEKRVEAMGGYMEGSDISGNGYQKEESTRHASLTIRVPESQLESFVEEMAEISNVTWKSMNVQDVTLQYVDVESHKKALEVEQERLLELLERAETTEDVIAIESRMSEVRYQLQNYESQLRVMDNQVNYSTIYVRVDEVTRLTPQKKQGAFERIRDGLKDSMKNIGMGIEELFIGAVIAIPYLVFAGIVIGLIFMVGKRIYKNKKNRKKDETT